MWPNTMNYFPVMTIKTLLAHKSTYFWLAQVWTLFVAILCLMNGSSLPQIGVTGIDKFVHIAFHFVFTFLWFMYFYIKTDQIRQVAIGVFFASLLFGIAIEFSQALFTQNRRADVLDVLANTFGSVLAVSSTMVVLHVSKAKK